MKILQYFKKIFFTTNEIDRGDTVAHYDWKTYEGVFRQSLYDAVRSGDITQVQYVLLNNKMASLECYNKEAQTPQELYDEHFDERPNPLVEAITMNRLDMVEILLHHGLSPNSKPRPYNPLFSALLYCTKAIPLLLEKGAHPIFKYKNNVNPIDFFNDFRYWARDENKIVEYIENAIKCGQSMNGLRWHDLIQWGNVNKIKKLTQVLHTFKKHGYDFSIINAEDLSILILLNFEQSDDILKLFFDAGVDFNCEALLDKANNLPLRPLTAYNTVKFVEWKRAFATAKNIQEALNEHLGENDIAPPTRRRM